MDSFSSVLPDPHANVFRRFGLLLRQDFRNWRLPALFTVLFCILSIEVAGALRVQVAESGRDYSFHWSVAAGAASGGGELLPVAFRLGCWMLCMFLCLTFFFSGTFSDLFRPQARARWLLLPAPLWEKLLSRWLCGMVLFPALALAVSTVWFMLRNPDPEARRVVLEAFTAPRAPWEILRFLAVCHALLFFLGVLLKSRFRVWPAFFLVLLLLERYMPKGWMAFFPCLLLLWPLSWVVLKRSRA